MSDRSHSIIEQSIDQLRQQVRASLQDSWHVVSHREIVNLEKLRLESYPLAKTNDRGYLVFSQGRQVNWLAQKIVIPKALQDYPIEGLSLRLVLTWWAEEAQIYLNGKLIQEGDLFDSSARILITNNARSHQEYSIAIRLVSPNHDIGALMRSHLIYEKPYLAENIDPGWLADELDILSRYLDRFEPDKLQVLAKELDRFAWNNISNADKFAEDLQQLRSRLVPLGKEIKHRCFNLLGHAHLDMAWLWTTAETKEVAERTFRSVLNLQENYPALIFGHTSPALYEWIEQDNPDLFEKIQDAVKQDRWELLGGMWIEPETNLVSGESLIRQLIYGQQYYQEKFGEICKVAWLPDSFGFTWQLPQIFKQCGIEYFVTGKLHWNDRNKFPHGCFWWESPDGTQILTLMSPPNVTGVMDTNPITMINYALDWESQTGLQEIFWLPGVGDHGGGPTKDMLAVTQKWHDSSFFPQIEFTKAIDYLKKVSPSPNSQNYPSTIPTWQDELYLELHRGCYTVQGEQKKYNRYCERLLYEAELWTSFATLLCGDYIYSQPLFANIERLLEQEDLDRENWEQLIEIAWKKVLFNQFHDILPGTSIPEVFVEANRDWKSAIEIAESLLDWGLKAIASSIELPNPPQENAKPIIVFNSLNWMRSHEVIIEDEILGDRDLDFWLRDESGNSICIASQQRNERLTFLAKDIPGVGYRMYWLCWRQGDIISRRRLALEWGDWKTGTKGLPACVGDKETGRLNEKFELVNDLLKVVIDPNTGNIDSIFDRQNQKEVLSEQGNQLQFFADRGQYWDAWNIDPEYEQKRLGNEELKSIEWIDAGLTQGIRVVKKFNHSTFTQDYILESNAKYLKINTTVDWQETHVMVKTAFPLTITSDRAIYEIPCGAIERSTIPQTETEKAQWEVSALNWADITDETQNYGVSLLSDYKHGYDVKPDRLRLTLLRSPTWPDPQSDRGIHHFTYAIYPHRGNWKQANTVNKGYELNMPFKTVILDKNKYRNKTQNNLPATNTLLTTTAENIILMALKRSAKKELIVRFYEAQGESTNLIIKSGLKLHLASLTDCLENFDSSATVEPLKIKPYKILTYRLLNNS